MSKLHRHHLRSLTYRVLIISVLLVSVLFSSGQVEVNAISQSALESINNGTPFYDPTDPWCTTQAGSSTGPITLVGNDNLQQIFNYFSSNGYTTAQAAGIVGNVEAESHGDPEIWEGDEQDYSTPPQPNNANLGWGIVQWSPASKILNYAQAVNQAAYELSTQVSFLWNQLNGSAPNNNEQTAGNLLKQTSTPQTAAWSFLQNFERDGSGPTSQDAINRETFAQQAYQLYAAAAPSSTSSSASSSATTTTSCSTTGGSGGTVTGCSFTNNGGATNDLFTTDTDPSAIYPNLATMCQRAQLLANGQLINTTAKPPYAFCSNDACTGKCDFVAGLVWGYLESGYLTAYKHWQAMVSGGYAHPGDRNPPVGALLFYKDPSTKGYPANDDGHVVVYLGNNMVVSSDMSSSGIYQAGSISIVAAAEVEAPGFGDLYLGWSQPIFGGNLDPSF